jgi:hypothetical protein
MAPRTLDGRRVVSAWRRLRREEEGIALVLVIVSMLVLTLTLTAVLFMTAAGARDSQRSNAGQKAYALAEAGVNNALAVLNANYPNTTNPYPGPNCLLNPQTPPADFPGTDLALPACVTPAPDPFESTPDPSRPNEKVKWWGLIRSVSGMGPTWIIQATGSVANPTGPGAAPVTRTIRAKVPVIIGPTQDVPPGVLNWLYSPTDATALQSVKLHSPFYTRGNLLLGNGVEVHAPLYVTCVKPPLPVPTIATPCPSTAGNVVMENTGEVFQGATVAIGGRLTQTSPQNTVGTNSNRVSEAHIVNGCETSTLAYANPCLWDQHDVYVTGNAGNVIMPPDPVPNPPAIDWPFWYQFGSPGPTWGCDSGTTPMLDTNDGLLNNSVPSIINVTPNASYSCKTLAGELTWDFPSKTLTVKGTIYIDGSVKVEQTWGGQEAAAYNGQGTIYMSGSFLMKTVKLCAVRASDGNDCNFASNVWDPNQDALIFVAKSRGIDPGTQAATGNNSVEVKGSSFQGVIAGEYDILSETFSVIQGPVISFQGGLHLSQTSGASFPDIHFAPSGAPGNPPPPSVLLAPREFGGG